MGIRAKMSVWEKTKQEAPMTEGWKIVLCPVYGGSEENRQFYNYTPGGRLELQTVNDAVAAQLEVGQEAYIDITPIPRDLSPAPEASAAPAAESSQAEPTAEAPGETAPAAE